jgi:cytochrome bd ubiquinol oxidase subunit II
LRLASLFLYALLGGADFGAGILEFVSPGGKDKRFRELASKAIAPVWEANHIWLIIALVILFYAFPDAHVLLATRLHLPMILMLVGILLRGSAFTYRYDDVEQDPKTFKLFSILHLIGSLMFPALYWLLYVFKIKESEP